MLVFVYMYIYVSFLLVYGVLMIFKLNIACKRNMCSCYVLQTMRSLSTIYITISVKCSSFYTQFKIVK